MPSIESSFLYRFDVYLPLRSNEGERFALSQYRQIQNEIIDSFGGVTATIGVGSPIYSGIWRSPEDNTLYYDKHVVYMVLTPQDDQSLQFFVEGKERWKLELKQKEMLITIQNIETV